jgi:hypothetical protein
MGGVEPILRRRISVVVLALAGIALVPLRSAQARPEGRAVNFGFLSRSA